MQSLETNAVFISHVQSSRIIKVFTSTKVLSWCTNRRCFCDYSEFPQKIPLYLVKWHRRGKSIIVKKKYTLLKCLLSCSLLKL